MTRSSQATKSGAGTRQSELVVRATGFVTAVLILTLGAAMPAQATAHRGISTQGEKVLSAQGCTSCHRVQGGGDGSGPDLARRPLSTLHSPAGVAAEIWNHAPDMWARADLDRREVDALSEGDADDLFAYLWSNRYFDPRGEAIEGKALVTDRGCTQCHQMAPGRSGRAVPSFDWEALADPAVLAQRLWNHAERAGTTDVELSAADMADLLTYLQNLKPARNHPRTVTFTDPEVGRRVFSAKGCASCHQRGGDLDLAARGPRQYGTFSGLAAALWNHAPTVGNGSSLDAPELSIEETRALTSYLYATGYFEEPGNARRGARVFEKRGCASCHDTDSARMTRLTAPGMVAALWQHGPDTLAELEAEGREWPRTSERDMADLIAYFNSSKVAPDSGLGSKLDDSMRCDVRPTRPDGETSARAAAFLASNRSID